MILMIINIVFGMDQYEDLDLNNCHKYVEKYHKCVVSGKEDKEKLKECRKILKYYEYCLIRSDVKEKEGRNSQI